MKIVVTGGAGFIGSHLVDRLVAQGGDEIVVLDNMFRGQAERLAAHVAAGAVQLVIGDIRDSDTLVEALADAELVYHLAAQSNVMGAVKDADYAFQTNVVGTFNVLKVARAVGARRVVFSSSREVYGEAQYLPVDEGHPLGSKNTYGASKAAGELYAQVFGAPDSSLQTAVLRLSNVYGPRDTGRVIPLWLDRACRGEDLIVFGGQQLIDFVWIGQVVEALIRAAEADIVGLPVNVGSGQGTAILELAQRILSLVDTDSKLDIRPARSAEVVRFTAEVSRMRDLLRLEPPDDPLHGLAQMVEAWYGA